MVIIIKITGGYTRGVNSMKNKLFLAAMFSVVLSLGLVLMGCGDDDDSTGGGGTFTLTGAEEYNGKYAIVQGQIGEDGEPLIGYASLDKDSEQIKGVKINGGTVTIPLYTITDENTLTMEGYSGKAGELATIIVLISEKEIFEWEDDGSNLIFDTALAYVDVDLSSGKASKTVAEAATDEETDEEL
jgi:hypothetical protein